MKTRQTKNHKEFGGRTNQRTTITRLAWCRRRASSSKRTIPAPKQDRKGRKEERNQKMQTRDGRKSGNSDERWGDSLFCLAWCHDHGKAKDDKKKGRRLRCMMTMIIVTMIITTTRRT